MKKTCKENLSKIPFDSEHIFLTDDSPHHNPTYCEKCGKSYQEWEKKMFEQSKLIKSLVIERLKDLPDNIRISVG